MEMMMLPRHWYSYMKMKLNAKMFYIHVQNQTVLLVCDTQYKLWHLLIELCSVHKGGLC
jgi:hypothetical protein